MPCRARCSAVKAAAKAAGAHGCTISGAGPTCVAVVDDSQVRRVTHSAEIHHDPAACIVALPARWFAWCRNMRRNCVLRIAAVSLTIAL